MTREDRPAGPGWPTIIIVGAAHFCLFADRALPSAFAPALKAGFALDDARIGLLIGAAMIIPYAIATLVAAQLIGRASPYRIMAWSILAWSAAAIAGALATSFTGLLAARAAFGIAQAAFAPAALGLLAGSDRPPAPVATSVFSTGSSSGRSGGLLIGGALLLLANMLAAAVGIAPWRLASLAFIFPNLLLAAALFVAGRRHVPVATAFARPGLGGALARFGRDPRAFAGHFTATAAVLVIVQSGGAWGVSILHRGFGLAPASAAMLAGAIVLVGAPIGHLSAGRVAARADFAAYGPGRLMIGGVVLALFAALLLAAVDTLLPAVAALLLLTIGGGFAASAGLIGLQPMVAAVDRGAANALFLASTAMVGYAAGPLFTGLISDALAGEMGDGTGGGLAIGLAIVTVLAAAVACAGAGIAAAPWRRLVAMAGSRA
jgi:MFS family permease